MKTVDTVFSNIAVLHTCASNGTPKKGGDMANTGAIEDAAIAVDHGIIQAVGARSQILAEYTARETIDCSGNAMVPGLIDCHTHIVFAGNRAAEFEQRVSGATYMEIMAAGGGIMSSARMVRAASAKELAEQSLPRIREMVALGVTTLEIKTGYGLTLADEVKMLQAIELLSMKTPITLIPTFLGAHAIPAEYKSDPDSYAQLVIDEMLPAAMDWYKGSPFDGKVPFFCDVFCEQNAFTLEQSRRVLTRAREMGYGIKIHSDEFTSLGGIPLGIDLGAASIDHLDAATEADIAALAKSDSVGVVLPGVNFNLGSSHYANARAMIDAGCAIALSTDFNPGSSPSPSLPLMMAISARYQQVTPAESLNACTINAAYALGMGSSHGSIEPGKVADLSLLNKPDLRCLSYEFGGNVIAEVWKNGRTVA